MDMSEEVIELVTHMIICKVKATQAQRGHHWHFWSVFKGNPSWFLFFSFFYPARQERCKKNGEGFNLCQNPGFLIQVPLKQKRRSNVMFSLFTARVTSLPGHQHKSAFSFQGRILDCVYFWRPSFITMSSSLTWSLYQANQFLFSKKELHRGPKAWMWKLKFRAV